MPGHMRLGVQVSIAGKIYEAVERAKALQCSCMQVFSRNPRQWQPAKLDPEDIKEFKRRRQEAEIFPLAIHAPYIINLASSRDKLYRNSIRAYIQDIRTSESLGADYFITHMGSHRGSGEDWGIDRLIEALNIIIEECNPKLSILLENTAGSGGWLGYKFSHHQRIIQGIRRKEKIGICFDTCHAYSAGYDISTEVGLRATLKEIDGLVGLEKLKVIHINDSKSPLGCRIDRHEHIGKGKIGIEGFELILRHPYLKELPFILETPKLGTIYDKMNLAKVKEIYELPL